MMYEHPGLAAELLRRMAVDQHARGVREDGRVPPDGAAMLNVDADNTAWLASVLDQYGWPGHRLVGEDAADAAWLLAQHADASSVLQQRALELLTRAVASGDATPRQLAYLTDRCQVNRNQPQTYGTQYITGPDGQLTPHPIADITHLDERRARAGMEPHAEYDAVMRGMVS
ncbi:DUF6624 domain-containing protein [Streptomyces sp. NPDC086549]|uniref:DUF6624 domain-containing protein n=1 Tax=Streptomyces sp. NPDC086549 TaxID=3365752 RepID=UPI003801A555